MKNIFGITGVTFIKIVIIIKTKIAFILGIKIMLPKVGRAAYKTEHTCFCTDKVGWGAQV